MPSKARTKNLCFVHFGLSFHNGNSLSSWSVGETKPLPLTQLGC